jgi:N-acetylglucosamine-6-sulfatase
MMRILRAVAVLLFAFVLHNPALADDRPNVIVILVDDMRFDDLGCTGHPFSKTPAIDALASQGLTFTNAFATTPLCSPSRASLLTGLHTRAHGIVDNTDRSPASHKLDTFAKRLHDAGYRTGFVGKWHMGNDDSPRPGWDRWVCLKGQGESNDPPLNVDGKRLQEKGYVTDVLTKYATNFIRETKSAPERPMLLYFAHKAVHPQTQQGPDGKLSDPAADNFVPAERHKDLYANDPLPRRPNYAVPPTDKPALMQKLEGLKPLGPETVSSDVSIKNRLRMLAAVDESTGTVVDALRDLRMLENALIIVTSDHGYFYGEHGLSTERRLAYEESMRIPLIVSWPRRVTKPRKVEQTVMTLDLAPTLLELAHAEPPKTQHDRSLVPLLRGEDSSFPKSRDVFVEYYTDTVFPRVHKMGYIALRSDRWKLIHYKELPGADELYDLQADPYELKNLASDPSSASALAEMTTRLNAAAEAASTGH